MVRLVISGLSALVGVLSLILVFSALSVAGVDEVTETTPHKVADGSYAVVFDQQTVPFTNTTATIRATSDKPIMLGVANGVDSSSFLTGVKHEEITEVKFPKDITTRVVAGQDAPAKNAESRDWWIDTTTGTEVSRSFDVDGTPQTVVIAPTGDNKNLDGTTVQLFMQVRGVLAFCLMGIALAILSFAVAVALFMWWRNDQPRIKKKTNVSGNQDSENSSVISTPRVAHRKRQASGYARRALSVGALALTSGLVLSGCGLPVAQPQHPHIEKYTRPGVRQGEASQFLESYSDRLDKSLDGDQKTLDQLQTGPLLDRTRAEIAVAEKTDTNLSSPKFSSVLAGSPEFDKYPMWFMAFGEVDKKDAGTQALVVTRESATDDWTVVQGLFLKNDQVPGFEVDENGAVARAPGEFSAQTGTASDAVAKYLSDGEKKHLADAKVTPEGDGFDEFRKYVDGYTSGDNKFDKVDTTCKTYDQVKLDQYALETTDGAVGFGEVRCEITLEVPPEYAVTLPEAVKAVQTSDEDGNRVIIDTSVPLMVRKTDTLKVIASSWFLLESRTEKN